MILVRLSCVPSGHSVVERLGRRMSCLVWVMTFKQYAPGKRSVSRPAAACWDKPQPTFRVSMLTDESKDLILSGYAQGTPIKRFGLKGRGEVFIVDESCVRLIDRASRFLRKDAEAFVRVLGAVSAAEGRPLRGHLLIRRAPVCSKARLWLNEQGIHLDRFDA